jgi:hypothetical protein
MEHPSLTLTLLLALAPLTATAGLPPTPPPMTPAQRSAVIAELGRQLEDHYVFPDVARRVAAALRDKDAQGGYAKANDAASFAQALTADLRASGKDLHLQANFDPEFKPEPTAQETPGDATPDPKEMAFAARVGYGVQSVRRLPGNVGYLEVHGFGPTEVVGEALSAAMLLVTGTEALILDLRHNNGGDPATVAHLVSHFFALGDARHLNSIYSRSDDSTRQFWTSNAVKPRYLKPVYVLTSHETFSGGEECAYDLQTQKRATLVGETTGGGANPGDLHALGEGFVAFIPDGRSINPVTGVNWEHVGVKPDVAVAADDARKVAYAMILRELIAKADDPRRKARLEGALADVEHGKVEE